MGRWAELVQMKISMSHDSQLLPSFFLSIPFSSPTLSLQSVLPPGEGLLEQFGTMSTHFSLTLFSPR